MKVARWTGITQGRLSGYVDRIVARADQDAVRRRRERRGDREVSFWGDADGLTEMFGRLVATDASAVDARLDALAATVCDADPRTRNQRRADALGAMAFGADRLACRCAQPTARQFRHATPSPVVIHVIADEATLDGTGHMPGSMLGNDALLPAELVADLARSAKLRPLIHPADSPPESVHTVAALRLRPLPRSDLSLPRCDLPAARCDLNHTTPVSRRRAHPRLQPQSPCAAITFSKRSGAGATNNSPTARSSGHPPTGRPTSPPPAAPCCFPTCAHRPRRSTRFPTGRAAPTAQR